MTHFTRCRNSHCTYCIYMWWRAGLIATFFHVLVQCYDVDVSCDYKGSISQPDTGSHMPVLKGACLFIKNDSEEGPSTTPPQSLTTFCVVNWSFKAKKHWMIFDSGGNWCCCESLEETAEDRRSICVLTQITTFKTTWKQLNSHPVF